MASTNQPGRYAQYLEAIRRRVCETCLDARDDGRCGLHGRPCAIEVHLPALVETLLCLQSSRMDDYVAAIEAHVCRGCDARDEEGRCGLREEGLCALYAYLPLVLDAVDEVRMTGAR